MKKISAALFLLLAACAPKTGATAASATPSPAGSPMARATQAPAPTPTPAPTAKASGSATPIPMPSAMSELAPNEDAGELPAAAVVWSSEQPIEIDKNANASIMTKDGVLRKNPPVSTDADQA